MLVAHPGSLYWFFSFLCLCVHIFTCMHVYMLECVCACAHARKHIWRSEVNIRCFSQSLPPLFVKLLLLSLELNLADCLAGELQGPVLWVCHTAFNTNSGDLNSDPQACLTRTLPTEPSPAPNNIKPSLLGPVGVGLHSGQLAWPQAGDLGGNEGSERKQARKRSVTPVTTEVSRAWNSISTWAISLHPPS